jgi:hypothetical protein
LGSKNPSGISTGGGRISLGSLYNLSLDIFTGDHNERATQDIQDDTVHNERATQDIQDDTVHNERATQDIQDDTVHNERFFYWIIIMIRIVIFVLP